LCEDTVDPSLTQNATLFGIPDIANNGANIELLPFVPDPVE
jgi:hypothetical protein